MICPVEGGFPEILYEIIRLDRHYALHPSQQIAGVDFSDITNQEVQNDFESPGVIYYVLLAYPSIHVLLIQWPCCV